MKKFSVEEAICETMIDEVLALKRTAMKKRGVNLWIGFSWVRIQSSCGLVWMWW